MAAPVWSEDKPPPEPRVTALAPLAVSPGFSGEVRLRGVRFKDATEVRAEGPIRPEKIEIKEKKEAAAPGGVEASLAGDSEIVVDLVLPSDAPAGPLPLVVVVGDAAADAVTLMVCAADRLVTAGEPGQGFGTAVRIDFGQAVAGVIGGPREVDVYAVTAAAGQRLRASVKARAVASLLDPLLTVYDGRGHQLAVNDDAGVDDRDAALELTPTADGPVFLVVQDALDLGSQWHSYLLEVSLSP